MKKGILLTLMMLCSIPIVSHSSITEKNQVVLFQKDGPPLVNVRIVFKIGSQLDEKGGEIYLLSKILAQSGLTRILENAGASLDCSADYDYFYLEYEVLSSSHQKVFKEIIDFLKKYKITQKEFDLSKNQLLQELKMQEDDYYDKVRFEFYKNLYQDHRYAKPITGNFKSVEEIQFKNIQSVYKKLMNKNYIDVILVGNVLPKDLDYYSKKLSSFPSEKIKPVIEKPISEIDSNKTYTIQAPLTQVFVRIGCIGIKRNDPNSLYYQLISDMVGGGFGSIVMKKLREEKGLTYSPAANFYALRKDKGYFFVAFSTRTENLDKSIQLLNEIFENLGKNGIPSENFQISRRYLYGNLLQREETNHGISQLITEAKVFHLKLDYWLTAKEQIQQLDYEKANELIKDFFKDRKFLTIILKPQDK